MCADLIVILNKALSWAHQYPKDVLRVRGRCHNTWPIPCNMVSRPSFARVLPPPPPGSHAVRCLWLPPTIVGSDGKCRNLPTLQSYSQLIISTVQCHFVGFVHSIHMSHVRKKCPARFRLSSGTLSRILSLTGRPTSRGLLSSIFRLSVLLSSLCVPSRLKVKGFSASVLLLLLALVVQ